MKYYTKKYLLEFLIQKTVKGQIISVESLILTPTKPLLR